MRNKISNRRSLQAFTLIEVLITVVVVGIAASAIIGVFINSARSSADHLIQQQAIAIAEAYMEEIQLKQFCEDVAPSSCGSETGASESGETRATYDDVQDYNDVGNVVSDQDGVAITELAAYEVTVNVAAAALGSITQGSANALRIDVSVSHPAMDAITLSGFRTNY